MPRKTLYILHVVAKLFFAFCFLFIPTLFWSLYGTSTDVVGIWTGRYFAALMLVLAFLAWNFRELPDGSREGKTFSQGITLEWILVGLFILIYQLQGGYNFLGWITFVICALYAVLFALDGFKN
jgi:hypothetical protein